jgi:hypothetical protein
MLRSLLLVALWCVFVLARMPAGAAPTADEVWQAPVIPSVNEAVQVHARVSGAGATAALRWRVDGAAQFTSAAMTDANGDGVFDGVIAGQADHTVVEFFIDLADGSGAGTWPAGPVGALLQVDATHAADGPWVPGARPIYRAVLREVDRAALLSAPVGAAFTGTLVTVDGTGEAVHYGTVFRSEAAAAPQGFTIQLPEPWQGRAGFAMRSRFPQAQAVGAAFFARAGLPVAQAVPVRFRLNGADLAEARARMSGTYARVEPMDGAWAAQQYPHDAAGNLYRVDDQGPGTHGELGYETPATAANYAETYVKITNGAANDYSDIIALTDKLTNAPVATYRAELAAVLDVDEWLNFFALDALLGNVRDGLQSGRGTGFFLYRGVMDPRFVLVPCELDTVLGLGENGTGPAVTRSIFGYEDVAGLSRMMNHPDILPDYYAKLLALMNTSPAALNELIDQIAGGWADAPTVQAMKDFIVARRVNVNAQIPQTYTLAMATGAADVDGFKTTTDGTATVSGTFHVGQVRSILVNGQAATLFYRTVGANAAGTWTCAVASGLNRGLNTMTAKFYAGANGTGAVVQELSADLYYSGGAGTVVTGNIGTGTTQSIFHYGVYPGTAGSTWKYKADFTSITLPAFITASGTTWKTEAFDDSTWAAGPTQIGFGDATRDENTIAASADYSSTTSGTQIAPSALFRNTFTIANKDTVAALTGEVLFDDSAVIYVNGTQVYRHGDLTANAPLTEYTQTTTTLTRENEKAAFSVPRAVLKNGINTIAVEVHQHDPGSADLSFDMKLDAQIVAAQEIHWTTVGSPYRLTGDATVLPGVTLVVEPGVSVFADNLKRVTVNGIIKVLGTAEAHVRFSHLPGAPRLDDPREPGTQMVAPKWGGILLTDSLSAENIIRYADFFGAQPTAVEGAITVVRSECLVDHCSFRGSYLHGIYGKNCSLTVQDSYFPTVFPAGKEALGQTLDNLSEMIEVDSDPADAGVVGRPEFFQGFPIGGHLRMYRNRFDGSTGHNDLVDITSGTWGVTPILDAQDNYFHGPTGDEHIDLNGDAYMAGNIFENCTKDIYTSDQGYANGISSDVGTATETTVVVARNFFSHVDHAVNVKRGSAVIFEHNTFADVNADYHFVRGTFTQDVHGSAVNFFIPEDTGRAGDGAYLAYNLFYGQAGGVPLSRVLSWADLDLAAQPAKTTKIEMAANFLDAAIQDPFIGTKHPDNVTAAVWQVRLGDPLFVDRANRNYHLLPHSPARGSAPHGLDYGATVAAGCYLDNVPPALTPATGAGILVGGPGIFAYQWRLDGGAWSAPVAIAPGGFPRTGATVRTATLALADLTNGSHTLEISGQDFAGNWQAAPTTVTWEVNATLHRVVLNEIVADALAAPDTIELHNAGAAAVSLTGWFLTDEPAVPSKFALSGTIPAGGYLTMAVAGLDLNPAGGTVQLHEGAVLADTVTFGAQIANRSIGRVGAQGTWTLCAVTPNAANVALALSPADGLRFSEWLAAPGERFGGGWVELTNQAPAPVALAGLRVSNNLAGNAGAYVFPALSFIESGGFLKLEATGRVAAGELPFLLDGQGGALYLSTGTTTLDAVQFLPQTADVSMGRNAAGALAFFSRPTEGFANGVTQPVEYRAWLAWEATAQNADLDGDGLTALAEYGLGGDPRVADAVPSTVGRIGANVGVTFRLPVNAAVAQGHGRSDVTYVVQISDSLTTPSWSAIATKTPASAWTGDVAVGAAVQGMVAVTVPALVGEHPLKFLRVVMMWTP